MGPFYEEVEAWEGAMGMAYLVVVLVVTAVEVKIWVEVVVTGDRVWVGVCSIEVQTRI